MKLAIIAGVMIVGISVPVVAFAQNLQCGYDSQHNFRCQSNDDQTGETCGYDSSHNYVCYRNY